MKVQPGYFFRNGDQYLALSQVPQALNCTSSEVTDAVSRGDLQITMISGCKAVKVGELFEYIERRGAK